MRETDQTARARVIFVFGSNVRGIHGAQAALDARRFHGATNGKAEGLQGQSYAIPTCGAHYEPLPLNAIDNNVQRFLAFARTRPDLTFLVTRIACGNAGYDDAQIAPLFADAPLNCSLPVTWLALNGEEVPDVR